MSHPRHVFVLMLENRSFDHFFGQSGLPGVDPPNSANWACTVGAPDRVKQDMGHELQDVSQEMQTKNGIPMKGFETIPHANDAMAEFDKNNLLVLRTLAREFVLFDNWFSSMPGPTWPNRFFVHAASSGGLTNSPSSWSCFRATTAADCAFSFENGTVFDRIEKAGKTWRIYHAGTFPQVLAVKGMVDRHDDPTYFRDLNVGGKYDPFAKDVTSEYAIDYTFLEPDHGIVFGNGDSQHPPFSVAKGERLVKYVYETIRNSPIWQDSALLVTWDEHGGFFDHINPPPAAPPGDGPLNHGREDVQPSEFDFTQLGVRVPALLISPYVPKGALASRLFPDVAFDHASIVRSLRELLGLGGPLTQRDNSAPSWLPCFSETSRADCPTQLPVPIESPNPIADQTPNIEAPPDKATIDGYLLIAHSVDLAMAAKGLTSQTVASEHRPSIQYSTVLRGLRPGTVPTTELSPTEKLDYIRQVGMAVMKAKAVAPRPVNGE